MVNSKLPDINYVLMTQLSDLKCKIDVEIYKKYCSTNKNYYEQNFFISFF